jgi:hypothetical protein
MSRGGFVVNGYRTAGEYVAGSFKSCSWGRGKMQFSWISCIYKRMVAEQAKYAQVCWLRMVRAIEELQSLREAEPCGGCDCAISKYGVH